MEQVLSGQRQCSAQGKGQSPATPDKHISGSKSIRASSHTLCRIQLLQLGFLCHSDWKDESKLKSLDTHPKQDILKKKRPEALVRSFLDEIIIGGETYGNRGYLQGITSSDAAFQQREPCRVSFL